MEKSNLRIDILGTSVTISAEEKPEYLDTLLSKYREVVKNVQRISSLQDPLKIAILSGFLLCDELRKAESAAAEKKASGELDEIIPGMILSLQEILPAEDGDETPRNAPKNDCQSSQQLNDTPNESVPSPCAPQTEASASVKKIPAVFFKLQNTVKNYEWGSSRWIPELMRQRNLSQIPWAELWMGVHPAAPSRVILPDGNGGNGEKTLSLPDLIGYDVEMFLGQETAAGCGKLPFLFKLIAAEKPLSIQA
ncbi:MAG: cell division protein ZapA, partial [Treponema sp.]|nr:cell division protein ZapA [Treponema sp.]